MERGTGPVTIRPETPGDFDAVRRVVAAAFASEAESALVDRIRASPEYAPDTALVAEADGEVVGHVMISGAVIRHAGGERPISMLSPLAVVPSHQHRGIGRALVRAALAIADRNGEPIVILEGSPTYYGQLDFEPADRYSIRIPLPEWAPPEAAQVIRLGSFDADDPTLRGTVIYPAAFDGLA